MAEKRAVIVEEDNFGKLDRRTRKAVVEVVRWGTEGTVGAAKQNVIRYDAIRTGDMMRSIHGEYSGHGLAAEVVVNVEYASYVHDGTRHMRPRPFLADAVQEMEPLIDEKLEEVIGEGYRR